ncbi:hypothetical protein ABK040_008875 [Willaertia magna]
MSKLNRSTGGSSGKKKALKKDEKPESVLLSEMLYGLNEEENYNFPVWSDELVKHLIEKEKTLLESEQEDKRPLSSKKKKPVVTPFDEIRINFVDSSNIDFTNCNCPEFISNFKEWKPLRNKWKPTIVREDFPTHPYFDRKLVIDETEKSTARSDTSVTKKPISSSRKSTRSNKLMVESNSSNDLLALQPSKELKIELNEENQQTLLEEFQKYIDIDIQSRGIWCEALVSSMYQILEHKFEIPLGSLLWERIWPKQDDSSHLPGVSPYGKYFIKMYFNGKERVVVVDDKLPHDNNGKLMFPLTVKNEYWPTIIMKGLLALAKGNEELVFNNPLWCFSCLFPDFGVHSIPCNVSAIVTPIQEALQDIQKQLSTFDVFSYLCQTENQNYDKSKRKILLLTGKRNTSENTLEGSELSNRKLYKIEDLQFYNNEAIFRIVSNSVDWKGTYNYKNTSLWTADFEQKINFCYQDRNIETTMNDFWISLEELSTLFDRVHILYETSSLQTKVALGENVKNVNPICVFVTNTTNFLVKAIHKDRPIQKDTSIKLVIKKTSNWKKSTPSELINEFEISEFESIIPIVLSCQHENEVFEMFFSNTDNYNVEFLSIEKLTFGKLEDISSTKLSQTIQKFPSLTSPSHQPGEWKIWMISHFTVEKEGVFCCKLKLDDKSLLPFTQVLLINNETLETVQSIAGKVQPLTLNSYQDYSLICYAIPNQAIENTNFHIETISESDVCDISSSKIFNLFSSALNGFYLPNVNRELFKYRIDCGDKTNVCLKLSLTHKIPITFKILKNEGEVTTITCERHEEDTHFIVTNLIFHPSIKTQNIYYYLTATIDEYYANKIFEKRLELVEKEFYNSVYNQIDNSVPEVIEEIVEKDKLNKKSVTKKNVSLKSPRPKSGTKKSTKTEKNVKEAPKIISKQEQPQIILASYQEPFSEIDISDLIQSTEGPFFKYNLELITTTPNIVVEEIISKKQKIESILEKWEINDEKSKASREKFIKQRVSELRKARDGLQQPKPIKDPLTVTISSPKEIEERKEQNKAKAVLTTENLKLIKEKREKQAKQIEQSFTNEVERELLSVASTMKDEFINNQKYILTIKEQKLEEKRKLEQQDLDKKVVEDRKKKSTSATSKPKTSTVPTKKK